MTHSVAIVFDSSGTLMHTYRVAKDMESGGTLYDTVALHLVRESQALVAIDLPPDALPNYPPDQVLPLFLAENKIGINIGCASDDITTDDVRNMLKRNLEGARVSDLLDVVSAVREKCKDVFYIGTGFVIDVPTGAIHYVVCSGGKLFDGAEATITKLADCADLYIASGDSMRNLSVLADRLKIPHDHVVPVATPHIKERLIKDLQKTHDTVVMVGDEINDLRAGYTYTGYLVSSGCYQGDGAIQVPDRMSHQPRVCNVSTSESVLISIPFICSPRPFEISARTSGLS
jgi:Cu+-exporting ATPase